MAQLDQMGLWRSFVCRCHLINLQIKHVDMVKDQGLFENVSTQGPRL